MAARHCAHIKANGKRCGGYAGHGSRFCLAHDPKRRELAQQARSAGGVLRSRPLQPDAHLAEGEVTTPTSRAELRELLQRTVSGVLTGRISSQRGKVVQDLARQVMPLLPVEKEPDPEESKLTDEQLLEQLELGAARCRARIAAKQSAARSAAPAQPGALEAAL